MKARTLKRILLERKIILPIIKGLGYSVNKPNQIIRSRSLLHPFVSIGSKRKDIYIIPDYLFEVKGTPTWILDAKSPSESLIKSSNVEQAYSYAIHSEVRVKYFALCNGREFVLYTIDKIDPILHFPLRAIPVYWDTLKKYLDPNNVLTSSPFKLSKDLGLHLKRLGYDSVENLIFPDVPVTHIAQIDPDKFTLSGGVSDNGENYVVTFDFGMEVFEQFYGKIPMQAFQKLLVRTQGLRQAVNFADKVYLVNIDCRVGRILEETTQEIFLPMIINRLL